MLVHLEIVTIGPFQQEKRSTESFARVCHLELTQLESIFAGNIFWVFGSWASFKNCQGSVKKSRNDEGGAKNLHLMPSCQTSLTLVEFICSMSHLVTLIWSLLIFTCAQTQTGLNRTCGVYTYGKICSMCYLELWNIKIGIRWASALWPLLQL